MPTIIMEDLPVPPPQAMIFEDDKLYACLASEPLTRGHCVVVWKERVSDLNQLDRQDYERLMDAVESLRKAIMKTLPVQKVYLLYMDEIRHVHWHLVPRYKESGLTALNHKADTLKDFSLAKKIRENW